LKIDGAPTEYLKLSQVDDADLVEPLMDLEMLLDKIRARNIEAFEPKYRDASVGLNDEWRAHVTTLVGHIREAVTNATVDEPLREAILDAVEKLQREVNRNRTRLDAAAEVWDKLTDAIGKGAKNLEPAVKIIERIRKRLGGVQRAEIEAVEHPKLPPPPVDEDEKPEN
jgi:hypothetical protein